MEFTIETTYDKGALVSLSRVAGKVGSPSSVILGRVLCLAVAASGFALGIYTRDLLHDNNLVSSFGLVYGTIAVLLALFFHSYRAMRYRNRLLDNKLERRALFREDQFLEETRYAKKGYEYMDIKAIASKGTHYVVYMDPKNMIMISKSGFTAGDPTAFEAFLARKTGLPIQTI